MEKQGKAARCTVDLTNEHFRHGAVPEEAAAKRFPVSPDFVRKALIVCKVADEAKNKIKIVWRCGSDMQGHRAVVSTWSGCLRVAIRQPMTISAAPMKVAIVTVSSKNAAPRIAAQTKAVYSVETSTCASARA